MAPVDNRERLRLYIEEVALSGDAAARAEYVHSDAVMGDGRTVSQHGEQVTAARAALDMAMEVQDAVAEGDKVVLRTKIRGRQVGEFMGLPGNGQEFEIEEIRIAQFRGDRVARFWVVSDQLSMILQLGGMIVPAAPSSALE